MAVELAGIVKRFPGVVANDGVDLAVRGDQGEAPSRHGSLRPGSSRPGSSRRRTPVRGGVFVDRFDPRVVILARGKAGWAALCRLVSAAHAQALEAGKTDTAEVLAFAKTLPGLCASVLVPNLKGALRAIECGAHSMLVPLSASHAHSLANVRKAPDDVVLEIAAMREARDAAGSGCLLEVGISTAFGCTIQGAVAEDEELSRRADRDP
jgi:hypothetical protein